MPHLLEKKNIKKIQNGYKKYPFSFLLFVGISFAGFFVASNALAATGINKQINFQGKVVNTDGTNVGNASYTFLFCIYTTASPATACTSSADNDAVWRESKSITTVDGIFQTNLGDTTAFASLIDFNTDNIYLGINFNSNGQMTPLVHFTTAPYALNADKVHGLSVTDTTGTLTIPNGKTIQFADAFTTAGAFATTLTSTGVTNATLPSGTITLADLATSQTLTNKTIGSTGLTFSGAATDITTGTDEDLTVVANGAGIINLNDATTITGTTLINSTGTATTTIGNATGTFALTSAGGLNVTTGGALTGVASIDTISTSATAITFAGTGTIASTTTGLTLDSGSNTLTIASSDTTLTASGIATMTLAPNVSITNASGNIIFQPAGSGTIANVQIGAGGAGSTTPDYLGLDVKSDTGDPSGGFEGAMYYNTFDNKFRCYQNTGWTDCIGSGGTTDLQTAYGNDADGSNVTISLTAADDGLIVTNPSSGGNDLSAFTMQVSQQNTTAAVTVLDLVQSSNAANAVNITANSIDTESGLTVTTNGLTSGKALDVVSSATAFTGDLAGITLSGSNAANTGNVFAVSNTGTANTNVSLYVDHRATGTNNLAVRVDDQASDTTPFVIDGTGQVGVGTNAPAAPMDIFQVASAPQLRLSKDLTNYSEMTVDSAGDLKFAATGGDIRALSENLWVCDGAACPALTLTGQGNIFVENVLKFGNGVYMKNDSSTELGVYDATDSAMLIFDQL